MSERPRIYQLMVRHFGNTSDGGVAGGSIVENGCGKFADINEKVLRSLVDLGITHLWLTGVLEHASRTCYPGRPADDVAPVPSLGEHIPSVVAVNVTPLNGEPSTLTSPLTLNVGSGSSSTAPETIKLTACGPSSTPLCEISTV